jgi:hypothetical protein
MAEFDCPSYDGDVESIGDDPGTGEGVSAAVSRRQTRS